MTLSNDTMSTNFYTNFWKDLYVYIILFINLAKVFPNIQKNKNDKIHKNEVQQSRWSDEYWQYRVAANITEYQNNLPKFMEKRQLFNVKNVCKNVKNQQV